MLQLFFVIMLLLATSATARADGFSSRFAAGVLIIDQADNLNGRGYATITSLHEKPRSSTRLLPVPLFELRYSREGNSVYVGTPVDEQLGLHLGYRRKLDKGAITGSIFTSSFGREWQNPYLVGAPRSDTRVQNYGGRVAFEEIGGIPLNMAVKGTVKKIVDEALSGDLRRDGAKLEVELNWRQRLRAGWSLVPLAAYQRGDYKGAANSFHGGSLGLGTDWLSGSLLVAARISGSLAEYDQTNPVFSVTRRDHGYRVSGTAALDSPFGWRNTFASVTLFQQWTDSNIDFFTTRTTVGLATLGYKF